MKDKIIKKAIEEIEQRNFGVTKQFLDIHSVVYENGKPKIAKIDTEDEAVIVYFPIENESFFFTVYLNTKPDIKVCWTNSEAGSGVYFRATSDTLTLNELKSMTNLSPTTGWSIGDWRLNKKSQYNFSSFAFEPTHERAGKLEKKISELLDKIEQDVEGVKRLAENANALIQVHWYCHNGNGMLGGIAIDKATIQRIANLGLEIDFDLYTGGLPFKE